MEGTSLTICSSGCDAGAAPVFSVVDRRRRHRLPQKCDIPQAVLSPFEP